MLILLTLLSCSQNPTTPVTTTPSTSSVETAVQHKTSLLPPDQAATIAHARAGLELLCTKSARACELLKFYDENAVEAVIVPEGISVVSAPSVPHPFLVIGDPAVHKKTEAKSFNGARFGVQSSTAIMELRGKEMCTLGAGLMLAHELTHAEEYLLHGEPPSNYPEPDWIIGEIMAHETVRNVMDEYSAGAWRAAVNAKGKDEEAFLTSQGMDPKQAAFGRSPNDVLAIKGIVPGADDITIGVLLAQMDVDSNLSRIGSWAKKLKMSEDERHDAMIRTMQAYYEQMDYQLNQ